MSREQIEKPGQQEEEKPVEVAEPKDLKNPELSAKTEDVIDEIDTLMDEVLGDTEVLDFITNFVQRGGE